MIRQCLLSLSIIVATAFGVEAAEGTWLQRLDAALPQAPEVQPKMPRTVLLFSASPGYKHAVIPNVVTVLERLTGKTDACRLVVSNNVGWFETDKLKTLDAVILNNTCSARRDRNLFLDALVHQVETYGGTYAKLPLEERRVKAAQFEQNLLKFVAEGKGLMAIHGAITFLNDSPEVGRMIGASFAYHPKYQQVTLELVEPEHRLLKAFAGEPFVHHDEPYVFKGAYADKNFRPLLQLNVAKLEGVKASLKDDVRYVAWIKRHGKGRVFYASPSHGADSYLQPQLLKFYLDGLQYVLGDLPCEDEPPSSE